MTSLAIAWLLLPFLLAFAAILLPRFGWALSLGMCSLSLLAGLATASTALPLALLLSGRYGVSLLLDSFSAPFLLLNALVCGAVVLESRSRQRTGSFWLVLLVLHGGINSALVCHDLISLYVALEVVGIASFLLISEPGTLKTIWIGLRYLLVGSTALLFYLIGAAEIFRGSGSFAFESLSAAPVGALALLLIGLLTKSGLFLSGLWLPRTHAEAPAEVSALLSGVVITAGAAPLVRVSTFSSPLASTVLWFGLASALLGLIFALLETDVKRLLAWSTVSQMGLVVLSPATAGLFALGHGVAKASLFLVARRFPSRRLDSWSQTPLPTGVWLPMQLASLSIAGCPLLVGYLAKDLLQARLTGGVALLVLVLSVGTAAVYARLWESPLAWSTLQASSNAPSGGGVTLLILVLMLSNGLGFLSTEQIPWAVAFSAEALLKAIAVLGAGWIVHRLLAPWRAVVALPDLEGFDDLIGGMGIVGTGLVLLLRLTA
ncbi:hypothetical protein I1E95_11065 [Synechococcus sp. CBW1107]|uniref:proton-conducting transporter transmembrane domain-containing protein n=1 Tax=Synechococcus sp. CBW1107 TaxID=2789857 RepID=UPI0018CC844C|nr:proton-conducting transporter membrane subunit [Synechococcus sp. CBW1107]QPN55720.1 hypothetical protein I1E95_11065 [Synechococcus sp. CBW1107]